MARTWIVVAESSRARVYEANGRKSPLLEVEALVHPEGRLHEGDLVSDRAGSDSGSFGQGRHMFSDKTSARDQEHIDFARELTDCLESARNRKAFDKLILAAPPAFLGLLRDKFSKPLMGMVTKQIDKNLVQQPEAVIRQHM